MSNILGAGGSGGSGGGLTVGVTTIAGGTPGDVLFDNAGVLGEMPSSGGGLTPAVSNIDFYVATTGSDSNPGTIGSPFLTIQHAARAAALFDYLNLYGLTIHVADGLYNEAVALPILVNISGNPVLQGDAASSTLVTIQPDALNPEYYVLLIANYANWNVKDLTLDGTLLIVPCVILGYYAYLLSGIGGFVVGNGCDAIDMATFGSSQISFGPDSNGQTTITAPSGVINSFLDMQFSKGGASGVNIHIPSPITGVSWILVQQNSAYQDNTNIIGVGNFTGAQIQTDHTTNVVILSGPPPGQVTSNIILPGNIINQKLLYADPHLTLFHPVDGSTIVCPSYINSLVAWPAGQLSSLLVTLPPISSGNYNEGFIFTFTTTENLLGVLFFTSDGSTILGAPTSMVANTSFTWIWDLGQNIWFPQPGSAPAPIITRFADLPAASSMTGQNVMILDCNTSTWGALAAGGGTINAQLFSDGAHWYVSGVGALTAAGTVTLDRVGNELYVAPPVTSADYTGFTVGAGRDRALVLLLNLGYAITKPTGVTAVWDSAGSAQSMTKIIDGDDSAGANHRYAALFGLVNPVTGTKNLHISWTNGAEVMAAAISFTQVDQTGGATSFPNGAVTLVAGANPAITIASATRHQVVGCMGTGGAVGTVLGTQIYKDNSGALQDCAASYANGAASVSVGFTGASTACLVGGMDIAAD